jgi:hypothetical protein
MENKKEGAFEMIGMRVDFVKQIMESQGMPIDLDLIISITIRTLLYWFSVNWTKAFYE